MDPSGRDTESPPEMTSSTSLVNVASPPPNQPLIHVAPSLPTGPLVFTGGLNLPSIRVTTKPDLQLAHALIFTPHNKSFLPAIFSYEARIEKVLGGLHKHGVEVLTNQTEVLRALRSRAMYEGTSPSGELPPAIYVGDDTTYSSVMEEAHHFGTHRRGGFAPQSQEEQWEEEIDAANYLLRNAERWGMPKHEIQEVQSNVAWYQKQLENLK